MKSTLRQELDKGFYPMKPNLTEAKRQFDALETDLCALSILEAQYERLVSLVRKERAALQGESIKLKKILEDG